MSTAALRCLGWVAIGTAAGCAYDIPDPPAATVTSSGTAPIEVAVVADAYVRDGIYVDDNFGMEDELIVKAAAPDNRREAFLRFDLSGAPSTVARAELALEIVSVSAATAIAGAGSVSDDAWAEDAITWNDPPLMVAFDPLEVRTIAESDSTAVFDVTIFVNEELARGDVLVSLHLSPESDGVTFSSRERGPAHAPKLVLVP